MADELILVVDDNPINVKLLLLLLSDEGYDVRSASDAEQTRKTLTELTPALILMDVQLPETDGITLTRELRREPRFDATWVIALTAHAEPGDEAKVLAAGCDGYVTKPIDTERLPRLLSAFLEKPRARL